MGYLEMISKYIRISEQIGHLENQSSDDEDLSVARELKLLRLEQKKLAKKIDEYNGVEEKK